MKQPNQAMSENGRRQALAALPKVELHRHLEGSVRFETLLELVRRCDLELPRQPDVLRGWVQVLPGQPATHLNFLEKFEHLRQVYQSGEVIRRIATEAVADAADDGIRHLELHFTPLALASVRNFPLADVFDWVITAVEEAAALAGVQVGLIASVNRHEPVERAEQVVRLAADRKGHVVGVGLAGNEADHPAGPFRGVLDEARRSGLGLTVHAGEWRGAESVVEAVEVLQAARVSHGVRVMEDPGAVALCRERRVTFETCLTSNVRSGVIATIQEHALTRMIEAGLQVTINTDDPSVCGVTLTDEYALAVDALGLSTESLRGLVLAAAQGTFLPVRERAGLERELQASLFAVR